MQNCANQSSREHVHIAYTLVIRQTQNIGSRALSFSGPLLSLSVDVCGFVRNFEVKYLGNQRS